MTIPLPALLTAFLSAAALAQDLALVGGTIYVSPTEDPIPDGVVILQSGKIAAVGSRASSKVPETAQSLDCSGLTITAGFWNSHVHFFERKWASAEAIPAPELQRQLQDMLTRYGFTSVFDLSSMWENTRRLRDRIESGEVPGPRIRSTGEALVPPGALPSEAILRVLGVMTTPLPEVVDAAQAAAASRKLAGEGVDGIKVIASAPRGASPLSETVIRAAVEEAHGSGKPVFVHPNNVADLLVAVRSGADIIAHTTPLSNAWDEATLEAMKERRVALIPTLMQWKNAMRHDRISTQEQFVNNAVGQLRAWVATGGTVLFGTDVGAADYDPSEEYALMAEAGMSFPGILASLTTAPAERFGHSKDLGRITAGFQADLVVLKDSPARNTGALANVQYTIRSGSIIYRASE